MAKYCLIFFKEVKRQFIDGYVMILDFNYSKKTGELSWRFKGELYQITVKNAKIIRNYEFLEKIFIIKVEKNTSILYVYDAKGDLYDQVVSTKDFFIAGIRGGILQPEFLIKRKGYPDSIFTYETKKKKFIDTKEIIPAKK